jgi:hypothetical protein
MASDLAAWQGFFTYVGLVAGGLTGLVFVALSLQISGVTARRAYVVRARTVFGALTGFLVLCGFALLPGQSSAAFGVEGLVLFAVLFVDVLRTVRSFQDPGEPLERALVIRTSLALALLGLGAVGCVGLLAGAPWAMALIGLSTLLGMPIRLIQAWALLVAALPAYALHPAAQASAGTVSGPEPTAGPTATTPDAA